MSNFSLQSLKSVPVFNNPRILHPQQARAILDLLDILDMFAADHTQIIEEIKQKNEKIDMNHLRKKLRDAWCADTTIIDKFVASDKFQLSDDVKTIVLGWKKHIKGKFICMKYFPEYAVLNAVESPGVFFGVLGLSEDFEDIIQMSPPYVLETVLLPFQNVIIWDGLVATYNVPINRVVAKNIIEDAKQARRQGFINTSLV